MNIPLSLNADALVDLKDYLGEETWVDWLDKRVQNVRRFNARVLDLDSLPRVLDNSLHQALQQGFGIYLKQFSGFE